MQCVFGMRGSVVGMSCMARLDSSSEFAQETAQQAAARLALKQVQAHSISLRHGSYMGVMASSTGNCEDPVSRSNSLSNTAQPKHRT